jgi:hypothetical protein
MIEYFIKFGDHLNDFWNTFAIYSILVWLQFFQWFNINSKVRLFFTILFFWFWTTLLQVLFAKNCFNSNLVKVQKHVVSKSNICDNNLGSSCVFTQGSKYRGKKDYGKD